MRHTGRIDISGLALEAVHHGAGTQGNTQIQRRQENAFGDMTPFVSGNSLRHMLRDAGARYALDAIGVPDGSATKGFVDLMFSGGSLGGKAKMTMAKARRIGDIFPILSVLGYSAGSHIQPGKLEVGNLHLVCAENAYRMPATVPQIGLKPAGMFIGEEFGTRHDAARLPYAQRLLGAPKALIEVEPAKGKKPPKDEDSTQMIFDWETILPGSLMWGGIVYRELSPHELDALRSALSYACEGMHPDGGYLFRVGAKRGTGHGLMSWRLSGSIRTVTAPVNTPSDSMLPSVRTDGEPASAWLGEYVAHLREHAAEIVALLEEVAA
jgi:hypothetical protein